jgi:hypothetical protein
MMAKKPAALNDYFRESDKKRKAVTPNMVKAAEESLGYRLPAAYVELLQVQNGGYLARNWFPTTKCPRWAKDHVQFRNIFGLGEGGIDDDTGSQYLIEEWEYPDVGVVISSDGHTAFMLDYSDCGEEGEPTVIWIDVESGKDDEPYVAELAPDFATFLEQLRVPPKQ